MRETQEEKYLAFISYRHQAPDQEFAIWLQKAIEKFRLPARMGAGEFAEGHLGRVFRDTSELAIAPDLSTELKLRLHLSRWLIVVCSPRSADPNSWVGREVEYWCSIDRGRQLLPVILEGNEQTSFPAALKELADVPLAASLVPEPGQSAAEMSRIVLLKIVARVVGVDFDDLFQRDRRRRRRQQGMAFALTTALCAIIAWMAVQYAVASRSASRSDITSRAKTVARRAQEEFQAGRFDVAALLARQAWLFNEEGDGSAHPEVDAALRLALSAPVFPADLAGIDGRPGVVALSPDGRYAAAAIFTAGWDSARDVADPDRLAGHVLLWDELARDRMPRSLAAPESAPIWIAFGDDGATLVAVDARGRLLRYAVDRPNQNAVIVDLHIAEPEASFAIDGKLALLATVDRRGSVRICDLLADPPAWTELKPSRPGNPDDSPDANPLLQHVALSPDGRWLAAITDENTTRIWHRSGLGGAAFVPAGECKGHANSAAFAHDHDTLLVDLGDRVERWVPADSRMRSQDVTAKSPMAVGHLAVDATGRRTALVPMIDATGTGANLLLIDPLGSDANATQHRCGHGVALSAAGDAGLVRVLTAHGDGAITSWNLRPGGSGLRSVKLQAKDVVKMAPELPPGFAGALTALGLRSRLRRLALSADGELVVINQQNLGVDRVAGRVYSAMDLSQPNVALQGTIGILAAKSRDFTPTMNAMAFVPGEESAVLLGALSNRLSVWTLPGDERIDLDLELGEVTTLAALSAPARVLATCADGSLAVLDPANGYRIEKKWSTGERSLFAVATRDERDIAYCGAENGAISAWSLSEGTRIWELPSAHEGAVIALAVKGDLLCSAGHDRKVHLWSCADRPTLVRTIEPAEGRPAALALDPRGPLLAIAMQVMSNQQAAGEIVKGLQSKQPVDRDRAPTGGATLLYRLDHLDWPAARLDGHDAGVSDLSFDPQGRYLATLGDDDRLTIWDTPDAATLAAQVEMLCRRNLRQKEWDTLIGSIPYRRTCARLPLDP